MTLRLLDSLARASLARTSLARAGTDARWVVALVLSLTLLQMVPSIAIAGPAILFEVEDGRVFYAEDPDKTWHPASLTKMLTAYIVFEEMKAGRLKRDDLLVNSETAHKQPPSKIGLQPGGTMSIDLGLRSLIIKSANDVAVMLAEKVSGSVSVFSARMNATAKRLGMSRSYFVNPNGLPAAEQVTTARDMGKLARALIRDFPQHGELFGLSSMQIGKIRLRSHNALLRSFEGADGMKTGFICDSGFNIVASASREGRRMVAVVLGGTTATERNERAVQLLGHGFSAFAWKLLFSNDRIDSMSMQPAAFLPPANIRRSVQMGACGWRAAPKAASQKTTAKKPAKKPNKARVSSDR